LIPFADGRASFGVVAEQDFFDHYQSEDIEQNEPEPLLKRILADDPALSQVLEQAKFDTPVRTLVGYSANVKHLAGVTMRYWVMQVNFWILCFLQV
jgi:hypothetical protein